MINVKQFEVNVTPEEMEDTVKVLVALSETIGELLVKYAEACGESADDAREAGEGGERALIVGAAACRMVAQAMRAKAQKAN